MLGVVAFLLLCVLPGGWITFGIPLPGLSFWLRLLLGSALTPLIAAVQFYLLRLVGASFELTAILLVIMNLPVLYLLFKRRSKWLCPEPRALLATGVVAVVIFICIAPFLLDAQKRLYTWEAWSQADVVYSLANGKLILEDAELAGVRLSYPWAGHAVQAVFSYLIGTPPVTNYIWTNLVWLMFTFGLAAAIVAELGGSPLSQVSTAVWLSFGVNFVGYCSSRLVPGAWVKAHPVLGHIWGDNRYTPWLDKVMFFGQMQFALGFFVAILFMMIRQWPVGYKRDYLVVTGLLLCGLGLVYPVLFPAACALVGARLVVLVVRCFSHQSTDVGELLGLALALLISGAISFVHLKFLTASRAGAALITFNDLRLICWRAIESVVVTSPLLAGLAIIAARQWRKRQFDPVVVCGLGALVSFSLYSTLNIPWWQNEYKFIFAAAVCLAVFPSLALEQVLNRLGRMALPAFGLLTLLLAAPLANNTYRKAEILYTRAGPLVDVRHFDLRLVDQEPLSGLCDAIRTQTPANSLLVLAKDTGLHLPTLTSRQLYVAPFQAEPHPGILVTSDELLTLAKSYPAQILADRRNTLEHLFGCHDAAQTEKALCQILESHRPVALILSVSDHAALEQWLRRRSFGKAIYRDGGYLLWLIGSERGTST